MAFGQALARAILERAAEDARGAMRRGGRPRGAKNRRGRPVVEDEEREDDFVSELRTVADAIGYSPEMAVLAVRQRQRRFGEDEREACSQVMDVMLAREPLPVEDEP